MSGVPRRHRIDQMIRAERAIREALLLVEELGADSRLTDAVNLLDRARNRVADWVDAQPTAPA